MIYDDTFPIFLNEDEYPMPVAMWVRIRIETSPTSGLIRRWYSEVTCQNVDPDNTPRSETYHYWDDDYETFTLRKGLLKADDVAWDLVRRMTNDPGERPI